MRICLTLLASVIIVAGCATARGENQKFLMVKDVRRDSFYLNGTIFSVDGFLKPMSGQFFLYPDSSFSESEDYSSGLDVVFNRTNPSNGDVRVTSAGECAVVKGKYIAFDSDTVGTGYFRSKIGFLEAMSVVPHPCFDSP